ncbi:tRNA splicing endonuclease subunit sen2 [Elasticomyces elasticus]|nr:tRNA splicing endonuclease subunit sen2 [Elasticomyces elasticus]KAK3640443.1 tRNA splicing endonuclease subunit sen2 [Elasticomyces elasticus]KAK4931178.1 tRNA splicing endonuclease subunit sen2 [Elasticomyces elasticus]KAK5767891.1 tRNA splicing endonuclease subunit sen2 [Elasticomyces elasticus]
MAEVQAPTGQPTEEAIQNNNAEPTTAPQEPPKQKRPPRKRGPNYAQIHSKPLPLTVYPLPAFHPSNPISLLRLCYVYISQILSPPSSHPARLYIGHFDPDSRSIHVTDPAHVRALWEMGFFGKASLSRSEPTWLEREKTKLRDVASGGRTAAEIVTKQRREDRRLFKLERARVERERIDQQRAVELGGVANDGANHDEESRLLIQPDAQPSGDTPGRTTVGALESLEKNQHVTESPATPELPNGVGQVVPNTDLPTVEAEEVLDIPEPIIENQEHLQLTLEEAFFLSFALGVLEIKLPTNQPQSTSPLDLLHLFANHSTFPPSQPQKPRAKTPIPSLAINNHHLHARAVSHAIAAAPLVKDPTESSLRVPLTAKALTPQPQTLPSAHPQLPPAPDSTFLLNYVVYHHFRSLGWVVRPGLKFGADYMLYNRGPVFSHAEFAVIIMPAYTDAYWSTAAGIRERRVKGEKDWWWLHCVNRVQGQVKKTMVLVYVDVPAPLSLDGQRFQEEDVTALLRRYKVREFVVRRWAMNRSRD